MGANKFCSVLKMLPHFKVTHFLISNGVGNIQQLAHIFLTSLSFIWVAQLSTLLYAHEFAFTFQQKYFNRIVQTQRWLS